jgi:hypothetical protein
MSRLLLPSNRLPLLSDFGEARFGDEEHNEDIMPNVYRASEVVLKINWDYEVDIWNVAVMVRKAGILLPSKLLLINLKLVFPGLGYGLQPYSV